MDLKQTRNTNRHQDNIQKFEWGNFDSGSLNTKTAFANLSITTEDFQTNNHSHGVNSCHTHNPMCPCPDSNEISMCVSPKQLIYLDNNSTHPIINEVKTAVISAMDSHANPSSNHYIGKKSRIEIENIRKDIAEYLNVEPYMILFTSGGTESNNIILKSHNFSCHGTEHKSVLNSAKHIVKEPITQRCDLSIMAVNNETGIISDLSRYERCIDLYHSDMCQALGKLTKYEIRNMINYVDFASFSGHKIGALPGVGFIYVKDRDKLKPLFNGGSQEFALRPGTYNYTGIVSLGAAIASLKDSYVTKMINLRQYTEKELECIGGIINFKDYNRVCNTISVQIPNMNSKILTEKLSKQGIYVSYGSACNAHDKKPSYTLTAMGLTEQEANSTLRISLNRFTTKKEIDVFIKAI